MPNQYTPQDVERFWATVDCSGGPDACWPWVGSLDKHGYGRCWMGHQVRKAHRVAWELTRGPIPLDDRGETLHVLHNCPARDNPACCNSAHHRLGTHLDNMRDMVNKGRVARGSRVGGAKLTETIVREARARYAAGGISQQQLAREYGVTETPLHRALVCKSWQHVK